jgi:hypothetical protein
MSSRGDKQVRECPDRRNGPGRESNPCQPCTLACIHRDGLPPIRLPHAAGPDKSFLRDAAMNEDAPRRPALPPASSQTAAGRASRGHRAQHRVRAGSVSSADRHCRDVQQGSARAVLGVRVERPRPMARQLPRCERGDHPACDTGSGGPDHRGPGGGGSAAPWARRRRPGPRPASRGSSTGCCLRTPRRNWTASTGRSSRTSCRCAAAPPRCRRPSGCCSIDRASGRAVPTMRTGCGSTSPASISTGAV